MMTRGKTNAAPANDEAPEEDQAAVPADRAVAAMEVNNVRESQTPLARRAEQARIQRDMAKTSASARAANVAARELARTVSMRNALTQQLR